MKFTVERKVLVKMLKFVSIGGIKDKYLRIAVKVINHLGDEVMKVFKVG